jgi:HrpA-like RNA helicase
LATNIAESSITIDGVTFVIDFCLTKEAVYRTETRIESLQMLWCSQASCMQRAGRTGRVCNGEYFCLVPYPFY